MTMITHHDHTIQFDDALRTLAAQATTRYPDDQARIERGLLLALNGQVTLHADGTATVQSGSNAEVRYTVRQGQCECADSVRAPSGRCKHVWSRCLVRKAQKLVPIPTTTRIAYHATYKGIHGQAIRDEQGRVWFLSDEDALVELFDADRPNLQLHGRMDIAAFQHRLDLMHGTDLTRMETATLAV
jgi:hypothetical protein